jgi:hypothetical protein
MRKTISIVAVLALIAVLGSTALIYSGSFNVAASEKHSDVIQAMLETVRVRELYGKMGDGGVRKAAYRGGWKPA